MGSLSGRAVVPGTRLCPVDDDRFTSGVGTYPLHGYIYASKLGFIKMVSGDRDEHFTVEVHSPREQTIVPTAGDIVTAKVTAVSPRAAKLQILCVRDTVLTEPFRSTLRKEDVRATEKDRVEMYKCFRPGDIILARVLSLGEASSGFLLSTAENELGVVIAHSEAGAKMIPVSWTEMQCPKTYVKHSRKVAKVIPENLAEMTKSE